MIKALENVNLKDVIIIDIETVNIVPILEEGTLIYDNWKYKMKYQKDEIERGDKSYEQLYNEMGMLYPEFSKIACIVIGQVKDGELIVKEYANAEEEQLLIDFNAACNALLANNKNVRFAGNNIISFDIPFIFNRMLVNGINPNKLVDYSGEKPWTINTIDNQLLWKSTSMRSASVMNIAMALGLDNPKEDMFGYQTSEIYYNEKKGLNKIVEYCKKDVLVQTNILLKLMGLPVVKINEKQINKKVEKVGKLTRLFNTEEEKIFKQLELEASKYKESKQLIAKELIHIAKNK